MLNRRKCIEFLMENRSSDLLAVSGLGSSTWDLCAAGNPPENFCFIGAMGQAAPFSLGLALAQPRKRVVLFTGDGDILMSLGVLATTANLAPKNLCIVIMDNESYGETGGQPTATAGKTDLVSVALGAGFVSAAEVSCQTELEELKTIVQEGQLLHFANIKISRESFPIVFPYSFDGAIAINRFREAVSSVERTGRE